MTDQDLMKKILETIEREHKARAEEIYTVLKEVWKLDKAIGERDLARQQETLMLFKEIRLLSAQLSAIREKVDKIPRIGFV